MKALWNPTLRSEEGSQWCMTMGTTNLSCLACCSIRIRTRTSISSLKPPQNDLQNVFSYYRMCSLTRRAWMQGTIKCVLYKRMCTLECVLLLQNVFSYQTCMDAHSIALRPRKEEQSQHTFYSKRTHSIAREHILQQESTFYSKRTHSIAIECVLLICKETCSTCDRMCSLTIEYVLLLQNVLS